MYEGPLRFSCRSCIPADLPHCPQLLNSMQFISGRTSHLRTALLPRSCTTIRSLSSASLSTVGTNSRTPPTADNASSIYALAASLPKASHKLRFTSIPPQQDNPVYPEPLSRGKPAYQRSNPENSERPMTAWSCPIFSVLAIPPYRRSAVSSRRRARVFPSLFPITIPRKIRADFGEPSQALDHIVFQDQAIPKAEKAALRKESSRQQPYTMSLTIIISKNKIHKLAYVRNKIRKRIRAAVRLVVQSGISPSGRNRFKQSTVAGPAHHLLPGHRYMMQTSLDLYRMPMDKLVPLVAEAFRGIYVVGQTQLVDQAFEAECSIEQLRMEGSPDMQDSHE